MKNTIKLAIGITIVMLCNSNFSSAQFNYEIGTGGTYGRTALTGIVRGIGIGNFTLPNVPLSALHVNTNLFPVGFQTGEVFRTQSPTSTTQAWRMFSGTGVGTQKFSISNVGTTNDVSLNVVQNGNMNFFTSNTQQATILANGNVGIATANPLVQLDVNGSVNVKNVALPAVSGYHIDTAIVLANYGIPTNIFVGPGAGANNVPPSTGTYNTFCGYNAGVNNKFGNDNVILGGGSAGYNSGVFAPDDRNIYIGFNAAYTTRGNDNVIIGANANSTYVINNAAAIGSNAYVTQDNSLVLGSINGINGATADTKVGIGTTAPTASLEINAVSANASGLKFTQLTSAFTPVTTATKYLSVDGTGNVILVNDGGGAGGGIVTANNGLTVAPTASNVQLGGTLVQNTDVALASGFNMTFSGTGNVGIGTTAPFAKLLIKGAGTNTSTPLLYAINSSGLAAIATDEWTNVVLCQGTGGGVGIGAGSTGAKLYVKGAGSTSSTTAFRIDNSIGTDLVEVGNDGTTYNISGSWQQFSDIRLKKDTSAFIDGLNVIKNVHPVFYEYNGKANTETGRKHIGIIAQQIQPFAPYTVDTFMAKLDTSDLTETQLYSFSSGPLLYVTINAIKQLSASNDSLKQQLASMQSTLNNCCSTNTKTNENAQTEIEKIKLTLPDAPVLGDARPNPNSGYAEIPYYLPENVSAAKIIFIDMLGRTMQEKILQTGYGIIGIDTQDLPSGTYTYSMILNGKTLDTKTMIKTK
ncbi:MAG: tail fiber domain-containing protein [Bacteroidetes bacterium]|nr:tail fiber domain-containing protein [Bacteroidota bacterium]